MGVLDATTGGAESTIVGNLDPNLLSSVINRTDNAWKPSKELVAEGLDGVFDQAELFSVKADGLFSDRSNNPVLMRQGFATTLPSVGPIDIVWSDMVIMEGLAGLLYDNFPILTNERYQIVWRDSMGLLGQVSSPHQIGMLQPYRRDSLIVWGFTSPWVTSYSVTFHDDNKVDVKHEVVWGSQFRYPIRADNPGQPYIVDPLPVYNEYNLNLHIVNDLSNLDLNLGSSVVDQYSNPNSVQIRNVYVTVNTASLVKLPNREPIPCTSFNVNADASSYCWGLNASLSGTQAWDLVYPGPGAPPVEVEASINGRTWKFVLDYPSRSRSFNKQNFSVSGRSLSAWLDEPLMRPSQGRINQALTANQIAELAILNTGWTLQWNMPDWQIPSGRFEYDNTPIGIIARIIRPVGGYLYTHPNQRVMIVQNRYPTPSWDWPLQNPLYSLPDTVWFDDDKKPNLTTAYNGVYVSGTTDGVLAFCKIAETNGSLQPGTPIIEALCCDTLGVAARMAGQAYLSEHNGLSYTIEGKTYLDSVGGSGPPLAVPGQFIAMGQHKGMVRSVSVYASRSGGFTGSLNIRQNVEIESVEVEP